MSERIYNISEVKKTITELKDKEGFLSSVNFTKNFISSNEIDFQELISLLKKVVPYMKKEKTISEDDILKYIFFNLEKYDEYSKIENQSTIADVICRVNEKIAIEYLEGFLGVFESDKQKNISFFESFILLSDYYLRDKKGDKAFQTIQRANLLVNNFSDKFDYLWKQKIIADKSADICLRGQKNPLYSDYLHYSIVSFILNVARDLTGFPIIGSFFYSKSHTLSNGSGFEDNDDFNDALEHLKIKKHKNDLLKEIYDFTFNKLPLDMGIPIEYFSEEALLEFGNFSDDFEGKYPKHIQIMEAGEKFKTMPFTENGNIHIFTTNIVKKYYDIENPI
ncbi:MAG: hypothetical protein AB7G44_10615 [Bacteroidia bacterium]